MRGVTGDRTDCSHGYFVLKMTRLFIRKVNKYSECGGQGEVEVQLERSAVSTRMASRGRGLEISATSTVPMLGVLRAS